MYVLVVNLVDSAAYSICRCGYEGSIEEVTKLVAQDIDQCREHDRLVTFVYQSGTSSLIVPVEAILSVSVVPREDEKELQA